VSAKSNYIWSMTLHGKHGIVVWD